MQTAVRMAAWLLATTMFGGMAQAQSTPEQAPAPSVDPLFDTFVSPPDEARPRTWWHWMNGNISEDGIRKDLAWMKRVGLGGLQSFDANLITPQIVDKRLVYMTPEWKAAFRVAVSEADRLGLEFAIASSPGWSETGGPWVKPEDGLKKIVWSETEAVGGRPLAAKLASPPSNPGPFQTMPYSGGIAALTGNPPFTAPALYRDIAVFAVPLDSASLPKPRLSAGEGGAAIDTALLDDFDLRSGVDIPTAAAGVSPMIAVDFGQPQRIRSMTIHVANAAALLSSPAIAPRLEVADGNGWRTIADVKLGSVPTTVSFPAVTGSRFRLSFLPAKPKRIELGVPAAGADVSFFRALASAAAKPMITELRFGGEARVDQFERKAGFELVDDYYALSNARTDEAGVDRSRIVDLGTRMRPDGTLDWTPPPGRWRIVRMGWSLLGTSNHPAPMEATGLEVDKYDGAAVRAYLETYLDNYRSAVGKDLIGKRGVRAILNDSIEVGAANWTPMLVEQFKRLRGYDPTPYLPALTGVIVDSRDRTDRFLFDYRRTLADLMASEHYGTIAKVAHENGLKVYGEALEGHRASHGDDMAMRSHTDVPMAAMWTFGKAGPQVRFVNDIRGAASVAHIYGQNIVAAESMTAYLSPWAFAPKDLRRVVDLEFVHGVNRPVIHTSAHQPVDDKKPGLSLSIFGQYFTRHETWAEMARPWIDYIARSSSLLQQGRNVADVLYFYGEEAPIAGLSEAGQLAGVPVRYAYDFANDDVLTNRLDVDGGELVAPSGARYRLLYLGGSSQFMSLKALERVRQLAGLGATIVGNAPKADPGLSGDAARFAEIVKEMWPGGAVTPFGSGRILATKDVEAALASTGVQPDFEYEASAPGSEILFLHRRTTDADIYFLSNRRPRAETIQAKFRIDGAVPEIWRADSASVEKPAYRSEGQHTEVGLALNPEESYFVVFRHGRNPDAGTPVTAAFVDAGSLDGSWLVSFEKGRGAPERIELAHLASLSEQPDAGIKYFSGVATYTTSFAAPKGYMGGKPLRIDLGEVGDLAEVYVNGVKAGTVWHAPYQIDIGRFTRKGNNRLEVRVANLWVNRLIGDQQPGAAKITYTALPSYIATAPLRPSGLIGPVKLLLPAP